ncbi:acyltransferase [Streptomyces malaysiensis]|uniref:acyltransferase n=1 Tax=Streptomyces malaysiensis TaxID=92644 RepID=UPI0011CE4CF5|nr:acyltransferase [Streptomyces malaysiensis]
MTASRTAGESGAKRSFTVRAGEASGDRIRLSVYDLLIGTVYTPRVFFYRETLDGEALRASLGRTLRNFPILSGRMKRDPDGGLSVLCDDSGVRFVEARSSEPMPDYGPRHTAKKVLEQRYLSHAMPFWVVDRDTPLFTVKLTHMKDGGSILGVTMNHAVADGSSYMSFLESWSNEHRGLGYPKPNHDRGIIEALGATDDAATGDGGAGDGGAGGAHLTVTERGQTSAFMGRILLGRFGKTTTVTTRFTAAELAAMKDAAMSDLAGTERWVSTNDALTAHLWKVLGELRDRPDASEERLGLIADFRSFASEAVPNDYWGNAVSNTRPGMTAAELRSRSLGDIAAAVRSGYAENSEKRIREETAFLQAEHEAGRFKRVIPTMALGAFDSTIALNNWSKLPFYEIDFGQGAPFWYDFSPIPIPWTVHIAPTPATDGQKGGRDVHIALPRTHARALQEPSWVGRFHRYAESGETFPLTSLAADAKR